VEPAEFVVSAVKQSEDGRGWLVRGYNVTRSEMDVTLKPWLPFTHAEQVNLCEQKLASLRSASDGSISIHVRGHEIASVLFRK
jgi:alpha-mannosidase